MPILKTTGKVVGKGAIVVGIAIDAYSIYSAYNEEGSLEIRPNKQQVLL